MVHHIHIVLVPMNLSPTKMPKRKGEKVQKHEGHSSRGPSDVKISQNYSGYGERFHEDWPSIDYQPKWLNDNAQIAAKPPFIELDGLIDKSANFPIPFPLETARCHHLKGILSKEELERNINSTYPLIHERVLNLYKDFLEYKRQFGSAIEKDLYKDMDVIQLVNRLLKNRAVDFWAVNDKWLLLSKESGIGGWDAIGTEKEKDPLLLKDVISYDEIKLSAFLYVSGYTYFVNNGNRKNCGVTEDNREVIEKEAVIIGLIGARLRRKNVMEYQDIIVTKEQNTIQNGYTKEIPSDNNIVARQKWRKLWADFYEEEINTFLDVEKAVKSNNAQYYPARAKNAYFDNMYYKKRLTLAFDALLSEANERAKNAKKMAYIHLVGIGLGVWRNAEHQEAAFVEVFMQRLHALKDNTRHISDVHFAYFNPKSIHGVKDSLQIVDTDHPTGGVRIHNSNREPGTTLTGEHADKLLVVTYAWDGNAQPGNEYWSKKIASSGDSAAASSTQVAELHNAHINTNVCAENLHVASRRHGLLSYAEYMNKFKE